MYMHFSKRTDFTVKMLKEKIERINSLGEDRYNELMVNGIDKEEECQVKQH